ncbi:MAG: hypothetical protein QOC96_214 [Acidobacteriota bacterium]|nr:hypothetical protein [Acidobacteriota bacterium]
MTDDNEILPDDDEICRAFVIILPDDNERRGADNERSREFVIRKRAFLIIKVRLIETVRDVEEAAYQTGVARRERANSDLMI